LIDFFWRLRRAPTKREYFIGQRGWLALLGSIPTLGLFKYTALLRLARLSRLGRISRLLRGQNKRELIDDVVTHRGQYAAFISIMAAAIVLVVCSVLVLQLESQAADANIKTGGEALWWALVTITTVGYGDYVPVTGGGRVTGAIVMFTGVGIIGALASILASILVPQSKTEEEPIGAAVTPTVQEELVRIAAELKALRQSLSVADDGDSSSPIA
jgi:voltage-gated potassium channel